MANSSLQLPEIEDEQRAKDILVHLAYLQYQQQGAIASREDLAPEIQAAACQLVSRLKQLDAIASCCQQSPIGKLLPAALYVHVTAIEALDPLLRLYERCARDIAGDVSEATIVKFHLDKQKISYLFYPDFDRDAHPLLEASIQVDFCQAQSNYRDYSTRNNPPILHRKDAFVTPDYPYYEEFAQLTREEEELGLLDKGRGFSIGTLQSWLDCLEAHGVKIENHHVIQGPDFVRASVAPKIERHKAAMVRQDLSRPVRLALEAELFTPDTTFFDYGCEYEGDIQRIAEKGYVSSGWDPYYCPDRPLVSADIVNLGYAINVIECQEERREALIKAWELTQKVLLVSAQVLINDRNAGQVAYGDGIITKRNTFQKYFEQEELKTYIDQILGVDAVPVALGIYFVFSEAAQAESFRASRFYSRARTPRVRLPDKKFADYQTMLIPLMEFFTKRGRLPVRGELASESEILAEFRTFRRAFKVILQVTDPEDWDAIADKRRQDLLVYIALTHFTSRPQGRNPAPLVKNDIKALLSSYKSACLLADRMLFSISDLNFITKCCEHSPVGKQGPHAFCVHVNYLQQLDPRLRLYEGCAKRTIGRLDGATVIKFHTNTPKISYLFYPDFDTDPHPILQTCMQIDLRDLSVNYQDYKHVHNPPILHQKDQLVGPDYPNYEKFARLSQLEADWGLLDDLSAIETRRGWLQCLEAHCATIDNYRLSWRKDTDSYRLRVLKAAVNNRRKKRRKARMI
ncbi:MAG: DNA phosphorothioation-associated putative methyltransferase [Hormoscilla sp. SP12CHS1]|nr:DNA phosphorothioation-associated putative methyltransferase [Hormoscilla sp. SP12CHS1]